MNYSKPYKILQPSRNVHVFYYKYNKDFKCRILNVSDLHIDNKDCRKDLIEKDLKEAQKTNAIVNLFGDTFDAMQGKSDKIV